MEDEREQSDGAMPRLLISAGLAPTARSMQTYSHNKYKLTCVVISEYTHSGSNLSFLHNSLKTASHLSPYTVSTKIYWKCVKERKLKRRKGHSKPFLFILYLIFLFYDHSFIAFFLPSFPSFFSWLLSSLIDGYICGTREDLEVHMITGLRIGQREREGGTGPTEKSR